jgi:arylsulfatase A-like enzyme
MMFQHKAPHRRWDPGPDHLTLYDDVTIPEPDTLFDDYAGRGSAAKQQTMTIARDLDERDLKLEPPEELTPEQLEVWNRAYQPKNTAFREANSSDDDLVRWKYQRYVKDYLRTVASVDDNVGRLLDHLDASGLDDNTVVIYSSDQGWYLGEHGWFDKRWMYEESLRTPLIVRWPSTVAAGSETTAMVSNLDLAPTFLDIAGADVPPEMQGRSLKPILEGTLPPDWRTSFYYHYYEYPGWHDVARHYGVRTERHKLIYFYTLDEWELYDLETDPDELTSVYDDPDYADIVLELKAELERLRDVYRVPEDDRPL